MLKTVFAEHDIIKREVGMLCQLVEKALLGIRKMGNSALLVEVESQITTMRGVFRLSFPMKIRL